MMVKIDLTGLELPSFIGQAGRQVFGEFNASGIARAD